MRFSFVSSWSLQNLSMEGSSFSCPFLPPSSGTIFFLSLEEVALCGGSTPAPEFRYVPLLTRTSFLEKDPTPRFSPPSSCHFLVHQSQLLGGKGFYFFFRTRLPEDLGLFSYGSCFHSHSGLELPPPLLLRDALRDPLMDFPTSRRIKVHDFL